MVGKFKKNRDGRICLVHSAELKGMEFKWETPKEFEENLILVLRKLHEHCIGVSKTELHSFIYSQLLNNSDSIRIAINATEALVQAKLEDPLFI